MGVRCSDGVVIGADTAISYGPVPGQMTLELHQGFKLSILSKQIIVASTGEVGLAQRFCRVVENRFGDVRSAQKVDAIAAATEVAHLARNEFDRTRAPWERQWGLGALLAMPLQNQPRLVTFDGVNFRPELVGERDGERFKTLPIVTMGSGQSQADPFLAHAHRVLFGENHFPTVAEASLLVAWTIDHVIRHSPGGVGGKLDIATLRKGSDGQWAASMWAEDEARQAVADIERHIGDYPKALAAARAPDINAALAEIPVPAAGPSSKRATKGSARRLSRCRQTVRKPVGVAEIRRNDNGWPVNEGCHRQLDRH